MTPNYAGRYGDALLRLQALDAAAAGQQVMPMGPQPVTGAFQLQGVKSNLNPRYAPTPSMPALQQAGAGPQAGGALQAAPQPAAGGEATKQPQSVSQIVAALPPDQRKELSAGIKKQTGHSVDELYAKFVETGELAPPADRKPRAKEKLSQVAEAMFRYMSNVGRGMSPMAASGQATLDTQGRRQALEQADIDEQNALAQQRRGEVQGVLSARASRAAALADREDDRLYKEKEAEAAAKREMEKVRFQEGAANQRAALAYNKPETYTDSDGVLHTFDPRTGEAREVTKEVEEEKVVVPGLRGRPALTGKVKTRKPLRGIPGGKSGATTLDPDTVMNRVTDVAKRMSEDRETMREIRRQAEAEGRDPQVVLMERAKQAVEAGLSGTLGGGEYGSNPLD